MYTIQTLNNISAKGLEILDKEHFRVASKVDMPDGILVRSAKMHDMELPPSLKAIARAGAGVNNIPIEKCTSRGIPVFNTPGANANSVKELVIIALLVTSRKIVASINWVKSLSGRGEEVPALVEKDKANFVGPEIKGKRLGVIGLGAVGVLVANDAAALGMEVMGYDPYISVESAWGLSRSVKRAPDIDTLVSSSDYITIHVPLTETTASLLNKQRFSKMKRGVRLLNFARAELVSTPDVLKAIEDGIVEYYATDFPEEALLHSDRVIAFPHLGASTPEAEDNCAIMAARQLKDFLECGNIKNSVNFPDCEMPTNGHTRVLIANRNIPNMVGQITTLLASQKINISEMLNRHRGDFAYNIINLEGDVPKEFPNEVMKIEGIIMARVIKP